MKNVWWLSHCELIVTFIVRILKKIDLKESVNNTLYLMLAFKGQCNFPYLPTYIYIYIHLKDFTGLCYLTGKLDVNYMQNRCYSLLNTYSSCSQIILKQLGCCPLGQNIWFGRLKFTNNIWNTKMLNGNRKSNNDLWICI